MMRPRWMLALAPSGLGAHTRRWVLAAGAAALVLATWAAWAAWAALAPGRPQPAPLAAALAAAPAGAKAASASAPATAAVPVLAGADRARPATAANAEVLPVPMPAATEPAAGLEPAPSPAAVPAVAPVVTPAPAPEAVPATPFTPATALATTLASANLRGANAPLGCLIEASAVAEVGTPVIGIIEDVLVERGDVVKRGQVLARHENRVERAAVTLAQQKVANTAELRAAKTQINFAHKKAERTAALTEQNYVSGQALEQANTEATLARMRMAQAVEQRDLAVKELDMARAQLQQRTIASPLDGVVVDRLVSPGERVENRPIFKIAQIDPLRVEVVLPAALFGRIQVGGTARVMPDLPGSAAHEARVAIVDRVVDAGSNTFRARLSLPNPTQQLPAGVRCRVDFGG